MSRETFWVVVTAFVCMLIINSVIIFGELRYEHAEVPSIFTCTKTSDSVDGPVLTCSTDSDLGK